MLDLRCDGSFKGLSLGGVCSQLILRYSTDTRGRIEVKCPRCKAIKTFELTPMYTMTAYSTAV